MEKVVKFKEKLEKETGLSVVYESEVLTTKQAQRPYKDKRGAYERGSAPFKADASAAALILQSWLDRAQNDIITGTMENTNQNQEVHLSVVVPAYNEEKRIKSTVMDIVDYLSKKDYSFEVIVVSDGSKDGTSKVVSELAQSVPVLKLIDNKENKGKGGVTKQGMLAARGKYRLFVDADNAIKITHLESFWPYVEEKGFDMVIGSIEIEGSKKKEEYVGFSKIYRNVLGKGSKYLVRALVAWDIHDTQRAFKLFTSESAEEIFSRQTIMRWGFDMELIVIARELGYRIKELPVEWLNPPGQVNLVAYLKTLMELFQIKINALVGKYR